MKTIPLGLTLLATAATFFAQAQNRLLPFQGRLTDAAGNPVADGARVVQFKLYDAAVGGRAVWNGEVHKLTVNGGLVNTVLGSRASLEAVDFDRSIFLEVTVDANGDDRIDLADPPLLPRQSVLPAVFSAEAADARQLAGFDWGDLMVGGTNNAATGWLRGDRIQPRGIGSTQLAEQAVTAEKLAPGAVSPDKLSPQMQMDSVIPPGTVMPYFGDASPPGWLICDGRAVSRTEYARLFAVLGTRCGEGDGASTFNVPDLRGRFLRGRDGGSARDPDAASREHMAPGGAAGDAPGSVQGDAFAAHNHGGGVHSHDHRSGPLYIPGSFGAVPHGLANGQVSGFPTYTLHSTINWHAISSSPAAPGARIASLGIMDSGPVVQEQGGAETRPQNVSVNYLIKH